MPNRTVYLPDELDAQAKQAGLSLSEVLQQALRQILSGAALRKALPDSLATKPTLSRAAQKMAARQEPSTGRPFTDADVSVLGARPK